ncbi:CBS domain-containing protein [Dioscorea alata]|uniref:CBS domain-containing protein n=2 Tax=Dioscorea alata TaxID=55571 RepID=A0ACB7WK40_DIOAL|nr:CBS domain-containing protein [Dioscorea alata]KAH7688576.1 CBS domain-containing protein [Dioscorea alata]
MDSLFLSHPISSSSYTTKRPIASPCRRHLPVSCPILTPFFSRLTFVASCRPFAASRPEDLMTSTNSMSANSNDFYTVGDFMTRKEELHAVKPTTSIDEAIRTLVEKRITGFPVIDDDWTLVGVVSDYDLLALDSISGSGQIDTSLFPEVDSSWKTFNEIQKLLSKTYGKVIGDVMTTNPLVVRETTNLEDAARLITQDKISKTTCG